MEHNDRSDTEGEDWLSHTAEAGRTQFGHHGEVAKDDVLLAAFGECAEANAALGVAIALGGLSVETTNLMTSLQNDMLDLAADLAAPLNSQQQPAARITEGHLTRLERAVEELASGIPDPEAVVLPGGTVAAAHLYQARTIIRRAERAVWSAHRECPDVVNPLTGQFLDRLSTLVLVLARAENEEHGNVEWDPGASAKAMNDDGDSSTY